MKHLTITLFVLFGVLFSTATFANNHYEKSNKAVTANNPPHDQFYIGSYHHNIHPRAELIIVNRQTFYVHQGIYFQPYRRGFVVVQPPRMARPQYYQSHRPPVHHRQDNYHRPAPQQCTPAPTPHCGSCGHRR